MEKVIRAFFEENNYSDWKIQSCAEYVHEKHGFADSTLSDFHESLESVLQSITQTKNLIQYARNKAIKMLGSLNLSFKDKKLINFFKLMDIESEIASDGKVYNSLIDSTILSDKTTVLEKQIKRKAEHISGIDGGASSKRPSSHASQSAQAAQNIAENYMPPHVENNTLGNHMLPNVENPPYAPYVDQLGTSSDGHDLIVKNVNLSKLYRNVVKTIQLCPDDDELDGGSLFTHVAMKGGLLLQKRMPTEYETFLDESDYEALYKHYAPDDQELWTANSNVPEMDYTRKVLETGILEGTSAATLQIPGTVDASTAIRTIYTYLGLYPADIGAEASYSAKFVKPHLDRIPSVLGKKWNIHIDTPLYGNKRPDYHVVAGKRTLMLFEIRIPSASKARKLSQPWEAFERAREILKTDANKWDWGNMLPQMWSAFTQDGVYYPVYKLILHPELCLFVEMGMLCLFDSFATLPNISRSISGIDRLTEVLARHDAALRKQSQFTVLKKSPTIQNSPSKYLIRKEKQQLMEQDRKEKGEVTVDEERQKA